MTGEISRIINSLLTERWSQIWKTLSRLLSRPLISIPFHCLPPSSCTAKAESHSSEVGVQPHLPTSERVCADDLWTHSAGMFFCGDYKDWNTDWEASTKLSQNNYFVTQRLPGGAQRCHKHPGFPTAPHPPTVNAPVSPDPLASPWNQTKRDWIQTPSTRGSGVCISHSCS